MKCGAFSFHFDHSAEVAFCECRLKEREPSRNFAANLLGLQSFNEVLYVPWHNPASFEAARCWLWRLKPHSNAKICGHPTECPPGEDWAAHLEIVPREGCKDRHKCYRVSSEYAKGLAASVADDLVAPAESNANTEDVQTRRPTFQITCWSIHLYKTDMRLLQDRGLSYKIVKSVGQGTFGKVYTVTYRGFEYAAKRLHNDGAGASPRIFAEVYVLERCIGVPCIVQLLDVFTRTEQSPYIYLVTELLSCDLIGYMKQHGVLAPAEIRLVVQTVFQALLHLHEVLQMAHADVKPANVLVNTGDGSKASVVTCKLADMGAAVQVNSPSVPCCSLASKQIIVVLGSCSRMDMCLEVLHTRKL